MPLISSSLASLVGGVSQQVYTQRLASQCEDQVNFLSSIAKGLRRRPPSRHIARLAGPEWSDAALHLINRDAAERYVVAFSNGAIKVFDLGGEEKTVATPSGTDYLTSNDPSRDFRAVTIADVTFVLNRAKTVALGSEVTASRPKEALLHVRLGNYGRTYQVSIDGAVVASYTTPDGSIASHASSIDTTAIAQELETQLLAANLTDYTITRHQNAVHLSKTSGDFSIAVEDGFNGDALKVAKDRLQRFPDLPNIGPDGFHLEIVGDVATAFDNYYVAFDKTAEENSDGVWREVAAQGVAKAFDPSSMPHVLRREADGTFTFAPATWGERAVGDADSAPTPSFVDRKINDVFFFRNRLGFLAGESVIMSRAGEYFDFWPKTVTSLLDSDPIDVAGAHSQVSILQHATAFNRALLLFSDQTQFVLEGGDILTPSNVSMTVISEFSASLRAKPASAGRRIYFAIDKGGWAGLREFYSDDLREGADAAEVTSHVPTYLPEGVRRIAAADNENLLAIIADGQPSRIYIYQYYWSGPEKLQSAWSYWSFGEGDQILDVDFIDARLMLVISRQDGVYLEEIDLDLAATEPGSPHLFHMDRKVTEADCTFALAAEAGETVTDVTLPYAETGALWVLTGPDAQSGAPPEGRQLGHSRPSASVVRLTGDHTASKLVIGRRYLSRFIFSPFLLRDRADGGGDAIGEGRLQVLYLLLFCEEAGGFTLKVAPRGGSSFAYPFAGRVIGADANRVGGQALETGRFKAPIYARNDAVEIAIESEAALPASFMSAEWEGRASLRSQRR